MAAAFFFNCDVGRAESPVSPRADALDFLGDAAKYAVALAVVGLSLKWRAVAAPLKGGVMGLFGLWVAGSTIYNAVVGIVPKGELMGTVGLLALAANLCVAGLLYPYRQGDSRPYRSGCAREPTGEMVEAILSLGSQETRRWRKPDSNNRSREGGHRRLGRLICCSREFPRCRLFRLSGAEVLRRTQVA